MDIWVLDLTSGIETRLTFGAYSATDPTWSPDGREIAFAATESGKRSIRSPSRMPLTGPSRSLEEMSTAWPRPVKALKRLADGRGQLLVEDDGVGRNDRIQGTGLGTRLVKAMAGNLGGEIDYLARQPGTLARLTFPVPAD